jgi:uncharacterized protein YjbI with pentapeptide repeats
MQIKKILVDHVKWLRGLGGEKADLSRADLRGADLRAVNLSGATLRGVDLRNADLRKARLCETDLRWADLREADLIGADLSGASLSGADFRGADLSGANLSGRIPLYADTWRRYVLYVLPDVEDGPRFIAGCRNFTAEEALAHWGAESDRSQPEYKRAIEKYLA